MTSSKAYEFGRFRLGPAERLLLKGGDPVPLPPKCFDTLVLLVSRAGHVVTKEELLQEVWNGLFVEENSFARAISRLRTALGDSPSEPIFIETVSKRGYRFKAPVIARDSELPASAAYFAVVWADAEPDAALASRLEQRTLVESLAEQRHAAGSLARHYGCVHQSGSGVESLFLFARADSAAHFALRLARDARQLPPRVGLHFGECLPLQDGGWMGTAIRVAREIARTATTGSIHASEAVMDLLEPSLFHLQSEGARRLAGDQLPQRSLYSLRSFRQEALASRPGEELTAEDWFLRALSLIGTGDENTEQEEECYRALLKLRPSHAEAHNNLGVLLAARGQRDLAAEHYSRALLLRSDYPEAHYNQAVLLEAEGRTQGAVHHYGEALRLQPGYVDAHHRLALLLQAGGRLEEAHAHMRQALELRPGAAEIHNNAAILLEDLEQPTQAEFHYQEALRLRPDYPEAHYNYALLLERRERFKSAERHYRSAIELWPEYAEAHNNLGSLLFSRGELMPAAEHYQQALKLRPRDPEIHHNYALLLERLGRRAEAEEHRSLSAKLTPETKRFRSDIEVPH